MTRTHRRISLPNCLRIISSSTLALAVAFVAVALVLSVPGPAAASTATQAPAPRLANWWGSSPPAENARRDYYVPNNGDRLDPDAGAIATLRSLNPSIILLASASAAELDYSPTNDRAYDLQRIGSIPTSWLLTQVGSTLTSPITSTSVKTIPVADTGKFRVNDLVVIDDEKCLVTGIGTTLTVNRGYAGSVAVTHASGTRIAAVVTGWPYAATLDMTADCPQGRATGAFTTPGTGTERASEWLARRTAGICNAADWDGVLIDVCNSDYANCFRGSTAFRTIANRTTPTTEADYTAFDDAWQLGIETYLSRVRALLPDKLIQTNAAPPAFGVVNGTTYEGFPTASTSSSKWHDTIVGPSRPIIGPYFDWNANVQGHNMTTVMTFGGQTDYRLMRFGLCTALMGDGYFAYEEATTGHNISGRWYDEFDNAGAGKGYLGSPLGESYPALPALATPDLIGGYGAFSDSGALNAWTIYSRTNYAATKALDNGTAKIAVTQSAGNIGGVEFSRSNVAVSAGTAYTLSFRARADRPLAVQAQVQQQNSPYTTYLATSEIPLTTSWCTFEVPVTSSGNDPAAGLTFTLGKSVGTIWIDDVKLQAGDRNVYRRDYEGGVALVNATEGAVTVNLGDVYRKIRGTQVPSVNDGSLVTAVTIPAKDGLVVLRTTPVVTPPDTTAPSTTISGVGSTWSRSDVTFSLVASDTDSPAGISTYYGLNAPAITYYTGPVTVSAPGTTTVSYYSVDASGNVGATLSATVRIDKAAPSLTGATTTSPNGAGWFRGPVTVRFTAVDPHSGLATVSPDATIGSQGASQSVAGSATDVAGNTASVTVSGIKLDSAAPSTSDDHAASYVASATIHLAPVDSTSGVANTTWTLDGSSGSGRTISTSALGSHTLTYRSTDIAGNTESDRTVSFTVAAPPVVTPPDTTAPSTTISGVGSTWSRSDVTFSLVASDTDSPAGISTYYGLNAPAITYYTGPVTVSAPGTTTVSYYSVDASGNVGATLSATVRIDKAAPSLTGATTTSPNGAGWFRGPVTVRFTAVDPHSGLATVSPDATIGSQGASQSVAGSATDVAGNTASVTVSGIKLDSAAPSTSDDHAASYVASATIHLAPVDSTSGVANTTWTLDGSSGSGRTISTSALGSHTLTYRSTDIAGNTESDRTVSFTVAAPPVVTPPDTTAPSTTISGVGSTWSRSDVTFSLVASDTDSPAGISTYYGLNAPAITYYTGPVTVSAPGTTTVSYYSVDASGNVGATLSATVRIDKAAPSLTGATTTSPNGAGWFRGPVTVRFTAVDPHSGLATVSPDATIGSQGASQSVAGSATDVAGNTASVTVSGIKLDSAAPSTSDDHAASYVASATIHLAPVDSTSGVANTTWTLDGSSGSGRTISTSALGSHTLTYRSTDIAGNTESDRTVSFTVAAPPVVTPPDTTAPSTTISGVGSTWSRSDVTFSLVASDTDSPAGISTYYGLNAPAITYYTGPVTVSAPGTTTVSYYSVDASGNVGATLSATVRIDKAAPSLTGATTTSPNGAGWFRGPVTVRFTAVDPHSGLATVSPDATIGSQGASQSVAGSATDVAGNTASVTVSGIKLDSAAPSTSDDHAASYVASATIHLAPVDSTSGVANTTWTLDGSSGSGRTISTSALGSHTLTYRSTDIAGNTESDRTVSFTVAAPPVVTPPDTTAPSTTISGVGSTWSRSDVTFSLVASDTDSPAGISTYYGLNAPAITYYTGPVTVSAPGTTTVSYYSVDASGNVGATLSATVRIDKAAPSLTGATTTSPNGAGWFRGPVTVRFTAVDPHSGLATVSPDATIGSQGASQSVAGSATDVAGNTASVTVSGIKLDSAAPSTSDDHAASYVASATIHLAPVDSTSGVANTTWTLDGSSGSGRTISTSALGSHTLTYRSTDIAGNTESDRTVSFTVAAPPVVTPPDTTAPSTTISGVGSTWSRSDVTFSLVASDTDSPAGISTYYGLDGRDPELYAGPVTVDAEGVSTIAYHSVDALGNAESVKIEEVRIDSAAPSTTDDHVDAYTTSALIRLAPTDDTSGIDSTTWTLDGSSGIGTTVATSVLGSHTLTYRSTDIAGNAEADRTVSFTVAAPPKHPPVYRFYNKKNGSHFYTASAAEKDSVIANLSATYSLDGPAYTINPDNPDNNTPLYRFYNKENGSHFYTASAAEKDSVIANLSATYSLDGPAYNVCLTPVSGATTVYRFYNKTNGGHFYTASESEKNSVLANLSATYSLDGPAFYLAP